MTEIKKINVEVNKNDLLSTIKSLKDEGFSVLHSISAVDYIEYFQVVYHLFSLDFPENEAVIKVNLTKDSPGVPTVCEIYKTANWQERECYDLMGVKFSGHPDLRRILLPDDWIGHTLQKNYKKQTEDLKYR